MNVSELDEHFDITQYRPTKTGNAIAKFVNGVLSFLIPYHFFAEDDTQSPVTMVNGIATSQQLIDLKTILDEGPP